jgi:ribose-phosphate pyrophosphokinase
MMDELKVFSGTAHPALARAVCDYLDIPLGEAEVFEFSNENIFVRILENVRERDVFIIEPICSPVNKSLVELLIMLDAFRRASAGRITAVVPYYGYSRTDKKDQPRVPITARLVADLITTAGANRLLTVDLHAPQIQGFFTIPVDELTARPMLTQYFKEKALDNLVVVATDIGISKVARDMAAKLGAPLAGSLVGVVNALLKRGVTKVYACCTHPVFSGPAIQRIAASPVKEVVVTDTIPVNDDKKLNKITVLSIASLIGEAIHRIHTGLSVGAMFE